MNSRRRRRSGRSSRSDGRRLRYRGGRSSFVLTSELAAQFIDLALLIEQNFLQCFDLRIRRRGSRGGA